MSHIAPDGKPAVFNERSTGLNHSNHQVLSAFSTLWEAHSSWQKINNGKPGSDKFLDALLQSNPLTEDSPLVIGKVILAMPYLHCYKVQLAGRNAPCIAVAVSQHSHNPVGVRAGEVIPPNSDVILWKPATSKTAYILAVIPANLVNDKFNLSDDIQQGGNSSPKKVEAYRNIVRTAALGHDWVAQTSGRPMDGTLNEYVRMSETGIGLLIDSFQAYLRVNEACGLWLNYFDSYAKLSGLALDIHSYCEHNTQRYDEGENFALRGHIMYPWEAVGMYGYGEAFTKSNNLESVQLDKKFPFAAEDLIYPDVTPIYRLTDHTGYIGQGFNRTLVKPARDSGPRRLSTAESEKDTGLFQELLTLDGSYGIRTAKQVLIAKYPVIPVPRRKRLPEDAQGDDYTENNDYKFSGLFGAGEEHKVRDWDSSSATLIPNMLRPSGITDLLAHHYNWKATHPFFYHKKDYHYPEEGDTDSSLDTIEFYRGRSFESYVFIAPTKLNIDPRYGSVNYFKNVASFAITDDGSIVLSDGYGSQITMGGGQIRLEAGGDVMLMSGARVVTLADEAIIRTKGSTDISSAEKDIRLKAEVNMQLLAGNAGYGGLLLESKGENLNQNYKNKVGEQVMGSGITLLTRGGGLNLLSKYTYVRTGVDADNAESTGDFVVDCANGRSAFTCYSRSASFFNSDGLGIWHRPVGQDQINIKHSSYFGSNFSKVNGPVAVEGSMGLTNNGFLLVENSIYAANNIYAVGQMGCRGGFPQVGDTSDPNFVADVARAIDDFSEAAQQLTNTGLTILDAYYTNFYWLPNFPGNTELLENDIGFSYRDESSKTDLVYGYMPGKFLLLESRWQQLGRMGLTDEGAAWQEKPVSYQGEKLYPWPGRKNWVESEALLGYNAEDSFILFDMDKAKSRQTHQSNYEVPTYNDWKMQVCDGNYKL